METPEAATYMAETSSMGDTHAVRETATPIMGGTKAAIHTYGATHPTHAAMVEAAVVMIGLAAIKNGGGAVVAVITPAQRRAANSRIVRQPARTSVGLGSSRLRSSECSRGQPNGGGQYDRFGREFAAGHRSLLWGFAPQFKPILKWESGGPAAMGEWHC
jgi:hypothetical protein